MEGRAFNIYRKLQQQNVQLLTTQHVVNRVRFHLPRIAGKKGLNVDRLFKALDLICTDTEIHSEEYYKAFITEAYERIGERDISDVSPLALTLKLRVPIWTNDLDFQIPEVKEHVKVYMTEDLVRILDI